MARGKKRTSALFLFLGSSLLAFLIYKVGPEVVLEQVRLVGWGFVPLLAISLAWKSLNVFIWMLIFPREIEKPGFWTFFRVSLAGDVVNNLVPSANLGGEVAKPFLLRHWIKKRITISTLIANKTIELFSGLLVITAGVVVAFLKLPLDRNVRLAIVGALVLGTVLFVLFSRAQHKRPVTQVLRLLERLGIKSLGQESKREAAAGVDDNLVAFYQNNKPRVRLCLSLRLLSQMLSVFETFFILRLMGFDATFTTTLLLFTLPQIADAAAFFVPGGIGTSEAAHTYLAYLMNLGAATGLSVALIKRLRRWFWLGLGIILLSSSSRHKILHTDVETIAAETREG